MHFLNVHQGLEMLAREMICFRYNSRPLDVYICSYRNLVYTALC
jgi:hypothetical protein